MAAGLAWTIVAQGAIGTVFFAIARQRGSVTTVTAMTFVLERIVPSAVGLSIFGDSVATGTAPVAVTGFVLASAATLALWRFAE